MDKEARQLNALRIAVLGGQRAEDLGERLQEPRKGPVRDKDLGDLWRLMAVGDPAEMLRVIAGFADHPEVGVHVRQSIEWTAAVFRDPVSVERAKLAFDTFVDPAEIDRLLGRGADRAAAIAAPLAAPGYLLIRDAVSTPRSYLTDAALRRGEHWLWLMSAISLIAAAPFLIAG